MDPIVQVVVLAPPAPVKVRIAIDEREVRRGKRHNSAKVIRCYQPVVKNLDEIKGKRRFSLLLSLLVIVDINDD